jgi:hypothetical protein
MKVVREQGNKLALEYHAFNCFTNSQIEAKKLQNYTVSSCIQEINYTQMDISPIS